MTNHIKELMKAAGVDRLPKPCNECEHYMDCGSGCQTPYPAFTPAKQLELIKLLAKRKGYSCIGEQIDYFTEIDGLTFDRAIAQIISNAISSKILNKSEVKRILEDDTNL